MACLPESPRISPQIISYDDIDQLVGVFEGADCVVHLAGILIESKHSNYASANVAATATVVAAAQRIKAKHFVFISVIGANDASSNPYFRSKGSAEKLVQISGISASIIRTPILLGPETAGAIALRGSAAQAKAKVLGGGHYSMRPLDIDDLCQAILNCCRRDDKAANIYELAGPEPIPYRDLIKRTAKLMGHETEIASIPICPAKLAAAISSRIKGGGMTPAVIDVITSDEVVKSNADEKLGISLTPLQTTLEKIINQKLSSWQIKT